MLMKFLASIMMKGAYKGLVVYPGRRAIIQVLLKLPQPSRPPGKHGIDSKVVEPLDPSSGRLRGAPVFTHQPRHTGNACVIFKEKRTLRLGV